MIDSLVMSHHMVHWSIHGPSPITVYLTSNRTKSRLADRAIVDQIAVVSQVQTQCHQSTNKTLSKNIAWESHKIRCNVATKPTNDETPSYCSSRLNRRLLSMIRSRVHFAAEGGTGALKRLQTSLPIKICTNLTLSFISFPFWKPFFLWSFSNVSNVDCKRAKWKRLSAGVVSAPGPGHILLLHDIIRVLGKQKVVVLQHFCPVWTGDVFNSSFDESFLGERAKRPARPGWPMGAFSLCGEVFSYKACLHSWDTDYIACSILFIF